MKHKTKKFKKQIHIPDSYFIEIKKISTVRNEAPREVFEEVLQRGIQSLEDKIIKEVNYD